MANGFLCTLFPFLLGLTLCLFLVWALAHLARGKSNRGNPDLASVGILWLTPACAEALGRCSEPGRLRSMSARGISARLDRHDFPASECRPTREEYSSWPQQAELICQGRFDELVRYQNELITKPGAEGDRTERANLKASRGAWTVLDTLLVLVFICAVLTALCWILTDFLRACSPQPSCKTCLTVCQTSPGPQCMMPSIVPPLKLSTDQLFEYADSKVVDSQRLRSFLEDSLKQYKGAKLTITGFTDPIGGACYNIDLAKRRVDAIEAIVHQFFAADQVTPPGEPVVMMDQLSEPDRKIADKCLETLHKTVPDNEKPLRYFDDKLDSKDKQCAQDPHDWTPNYIWGRSCGGDGVDNSVDDEKKCLSHYKFKGKDKDATTLIAMKRAANFYRLQRCLAPLRRVEIMIDNRPGAAGGSGAGK